MGFDVINKKFWIGVFVVFCMLQATNWATAANGGMIDYSSYNNPPTEWFWVYVGSVATCSVVLYQFLRLVHDHRDTACGRISIITHCVLLWITLMSYNCCYDLYRINLTEKLFEALPHITWAVFCGCTSIMGVFISLYLIKKLFE